MQLWSPARGALLELGRRKIVGGQEDLIEDTALTMARERDQPDTSTGQRVTVSVGPYR